MKGKEAGLFDNKALASLILPLLVEQFLAVLVGMADSIMVASVGEAAVSGVSLVDNVMVLFINLFAALATGGAVIAGQYLGQEDRKSSGKAATQLIWFMTAVSFGIMMLKNGTPASPATAFAIRVLPVPGGPTNSTPLGIRAPTFV